jgi:hypothetical protein
MGLSKISTAVSAVALAAACATSAHAAVWNEVGDANQLLPTAQIVSTGTNRINGSIQPAADVDMYRIQVGAGLFTASTVGLSSVDTQLYLFDATGHGIVGNDDAANNVLQSTISANLAAGIYYIAISAFNSDPTSAGGRIFPDTTDFSGDPQWTPTGPGGAGVLTGWTAPGGANTTQVGAYGIQFNVSTVPEPATLGLVGLALAGALVTRRKSQRV